jgi:hypothetical protein
VDFSRERDTHRVKSDDPAPEPNWRSQTLEASRPLDAAVGLYSTLAPVYELRARVTESRPRRRVLELANVRNGEEILEVATGTGAQLVSLAQRNPSGRTAGVELADGMLAQTGKRLRAGGLTSGLGFCEIRREYIAQMLFQTEIVSARKADREGIP